MSELGGLFEDVTERIFTDLVSQELLESSERGEWPEELWKAVEESGLTRALLPEDQGGAGAGWSDVYPILAAAGRHAAPIPLAECMLANWTLHRAGFEVPEGRVSFGTTVVPQVLSAGMKLTAELKGIPWGRNADFVLVVGEENGIFSLALVSAKEGEMESTENLAREPRDTFRFSEAPLIAAHRIEMPSDVLNPYGAMFRTAQMAGALEALLEMSVGYANERVQFGRPIGKFQAIQQELARLAGEVAASGMASKAAFHAADLASKDPAFDPTLEIAAAKIRLGDAADLAPGIAHQVHGAIGFTYEHRLHFFTRRLWSWRAEFGTASQWADRLGAMVEQHGASGLWPWVTSR